MESNSLKKEILIVDDSPMNIKLLGAGLKRHFKLKFATSGEKALEIAHSEVSPDLILLDIMMPEMDGYEVCRRLKESEKTQGIPVIFVTAKGMQEMSKGLAAGAVDYISKPVNMDLLLSSVNTHLAPKNNINIL